MLYTLLPFLLSWIMLEKQIAVCYFCVSSSLKLPVSATWRSPSSTAPSLGKHYSIWQPFSQLFLTNKQPVTAKVFFFTLAKNQFNPAYLRTCVLTGKDWGNRTLHVPLFYTDLWGLWLCFACCWAYTPAETQSGPPAIDINRNSLS